MKSKWQRINTSQFPSNIHIIYTNHDAQNVQKMPESLHSSQRHTAFKGTHIISNLFLCNSTVSQPSILFYAQKIHWCLNDDNLTKTPPCYLPCSLSKLYRDTGIIPPYWEKEMVHVESN